MIDYGQDAPHERRPDDVERARILSLLLDEYEPGTCTDLACGLGWFSRIAADKGWQVTAFDARNRNWPPHPGVTWSVQDVRDARLDGYDLILCLGIFYHLTFEDQISLIRKCAGTPVILDTHVTTGTVEQIYEDRYGGRLYQETGDVLAAVGNLTSFWPTVESQVRMWRDFGGYLEVTAVEPWWAPNRTFFTCVP